MKEGKPQPESDAPDDGRAQIEIEVVVEQIWRDMNGSATRTDIRSVLAEIAPRYDGVRIRTFVPIFLRRDVRRRLQSGLGRSEMVGGSEASSTSGKETRTVRENDIDSAGVVINDLEPTGTS